MEHRSAPTVVKCRRCGKDAECYVRPSGALFEHCTACGYGVIIPRRMPTEKEQAETQRRGPTPAHHKQVNP